MTARFRARAFAMTVAWVVAGGANGQPPEPEVSTAQNDVLFFDTAVPFLGPVDIVGGLGSVPGARVQGKPYTADSITESTQTLLDGNRIVHRNEAHIVRDTAGRTRLEQTLRGLGGAVTRAPATLITIDDPVAQVSFVLDPVAQTATKTRRFRLTRNAGLEVEHEVEVSAGPSSAGAGTVAIVTRRAEGLPGVAVPPSAGFALNIAGPEPAAQQTTEDLGEQVLEGLLTRGTRSRQTIPAGALGNERPIEVVTEQWYSPDLEAVVFRRHVDPRAGETTYRLVNVVRGEPSEGLFMVPQGYELVEPPPFGQLPPPPPGGAARVETHVVVVGAPDESPEPSP